MKKLFTFLAALGLGLGLTIQPVEAKRLGNGQNIGEQKQGFAREATNPNLPAGTNTNPYPSRTTPAANAQPKNSSAWFGPLAGLAAGGLLAALLFGEAFEGIQVLDILLFIFMAVGLFMLIRMLRPKSSEPQMQNAQYATAGAPLTIPPITQADRPNTGSDPQRAPLTDTPSWFNEETFLKAAKQHFLTLQLAWDMNDMAKLEEYFTPELFEELRAMRAEIGHIPIQTDIQALHAQLLGLIHDGEMIVASILFQGRVREDSGLPEEFAEIWHVRHPAETPHGEWRISGLQQADLRTLH